MVLDTGELRGIITHGDIRGADLLRAARVDSLDIAVALRRARIYEVMVEQPITCLSAAVTCASTSGGWPS